MDEFEVGPRWNEEVEKSVLGSVMYDRTTADDLTLQPEDFYRTAHEELWALIQNQLGIGRPVDPVSLSEILTARPIRGLQATYLHECVASAPVKSAVGHHAEMILGLSQMRRMGEVGARLTQLSRNGDWENATATVDRARAVLDGVVADAANIQTRTFAQALEQSIEEWRAPKRKGHPTGWSELDAKLNGGWLPGQCTVIGARPAIGKSVVAGCAAVAAHSYGAGFFSLEMPEHEVVGRMAAAAQGIDLGRLNSGKLTQEDWDKIRRLVVRSQDWRIYIEDRSKLSMAQIRATVRTWTRRGPLPLVIIDYSQLVTPADRSEQRERQVSRILEDCKHLAKEFDTHVLALAQVNRGSTGRVDKRPTMSDLRESGGIEAHADNIILLHRDDDMESEIELIIEKNRHGQTGTVRLAWRPWVASANTMAPEPTDYPYGKDVPA